MGVVRGRGRIEEEEKRKRGQTMQIVYINFEEHTKSCERLKIRLCSSAMTTASIVVLWPASTATGLEGT